MSRKCKWQGCVITNWVSPDLDLCVHHAKIGYDAYTRRLTEREAARAADDDERHVRATVMETQVLTTGEPAAAGFGNGWVYYLQVGERIKIGHTRNLERRMKEYPPNSVLLGIEMGGRRIENMRHQQFSAYLADGREWFKDTPEIRDHITKVDHTTGYTARRGPSAGAIATPRVRRAGRRVG